MRNRSNLLALIVLIGVVQPASSRAASPSAGAAWDNVATILQTKEVFAGGYHRFNLPRRDI